MTILLLLGGVCCLCLMCSSGMVLLYNTNKDFKASIDGMFGGGGDDESAEESSMSGEYVCPDAPPGFDPFGEPERDGDVYWCKHRDSGDTSVKNRLIRNHSRASRLPDPAVKGKTYEYDTIEERETKDGKRGEFGPGISGFGKDDKTLFKYTAP